MSSSCYACIIAFGKLGGGVVSVIALVEGMYTIGLLTGRYLCADIAVRILYHFGSGNPHHDHVF